jgi:hypothetical protein
LGPEIISFKENINKIQENIFECSPVKSLHDHMQWWEYMNNNGRETVRAKHLIKNSIKCENKLQKM